MIEIRHKSKLELALEQLWSGNCPDGLKIDLYNNNIGDEGAKAIAEALQSGKCPVGLNINLNYTINGQCT